MVIGILLVCLLYSLMNCYIGYRIFIAMKDNFNIMIPIIISVAIGILTITTLISYMLSSKNIGSIVGKLGSYWMAISLVTFFTFLIISILSKAIKLFKIIDVSTSFQGIISLIIVAIIITMGTYNSNNVKVVDYNVEINKKSNIDNLKIVAISDLHLGYINDNNKLKEDVELINKEKPDLVVILGDVFDGNFKAVKSSEETKEILSGIKSKYGTYLCWGNHDAGNDFQLMRDFIKDTNITLLEDEFVNIDNKFIVIGRKDSTPIGDQGSARKDLEEVVANIDRDLPIIVLDHQPSNIDEYRGIGDLVLCGHTHAGQIFPINYITSKLFVTDYGYKKYDDGTQIIVSSGLGTWGPPIRIGSNNEIISINVLVR